MFPLSPRTYPPRFGLFLVRLHEDLCRSREIHLPHPNVQTETAEKLFFLMDWGDLWEDASAIEVLCWLRGNRHLDLGEWRELFPLTL